jgi:L-fucose isomerase-like protein
MAIKIIPFFSTLTPESLRDVVLEKMKIDDIEILMPEDYTTMLQIEPERVRGQIYILVGSGGSENLIDDFVSKTELPHTIFLLSHGLNNSLPAAMETRASLDQQGYASRIIHGSLGELSDQLQIRAKYAAIIERIGESKLGIIGKPSNWLIASGVDDDSVKRRWGLTIERLPIDILLDNVTQDLSGESESHLKEFLNKASSSDISEEEAEKAARVAQQLSKIVESEELNAVTLECFDLLMQTKVSGCYALSILNERALFVAGCEGDIPSTFTMLLAKHLTQKPVFMANVTDIDAASNIATFAHCTLPTSIATDYRIMTHYETGMSLGIRGTIGSQSVTVLKVSGDDLTRYWVSKGDIVENLENETGCRTQIRVKLQEPVTYFLEKSLANHHILILGDFAKEFNDFFSFAINGW